MCRSRDRTHAVIVPPLAEGTIDRPMSRGCRTTVAVGGRPIASISTGVAITPPTETVISSCWTKLPSLWSVALSVHRPAWRGVMSNRALPRDCPERGTRSGRVRSEIVKSSLSSCTVNATSSTPLGKSSSSANRAVAVAEARCVVSMPKATVYVLVGSSGSSAGDLRFRR